MSKVAHRNKVLPTSCRKMYSFCWISLFWYCISEYNGVDCILLGDLIQCRSRCSKVSVCQSAIFMFWLITGCWLCPPHSHAQFCDVSDTGEICGSWTFHLICALTPKCIRLLFSCVFFLIAQLLNSSLDCSDWTEAPSSVGLLQKFIKTAQRFENYVRRSRDLDVTTRGEGFIHFYFLCQ